MPLMQPIGNPNIHLTKISDMDILHGYRIKYYPEIDSTNAEAHRLIGMGEVGHKLILVADYQQSGRGQTGNHWESEAGKNLLFTLCVQPVFLPSKNQFLLSEIVSLATCETLNEYCPGIEIKWPNDIYYGEKKLCGILIENTLTSTKIAQSFIGVGINVNQVTFNSDAPNPVSLLQINGNEIDRKNILETFIRHFDIYFNQLSNNDFSSVQKDYRNHLFRREGFHPYRDSKGEFQARLVDVLQDGHLILQDEKCQTRSYMFKEVEFIL